MLTITRKKINADGSVELDMECEMFELKTFMDCQEFVSKEMANRYYESTAKNLLLHNIEKYLNSALEKESEKYKYFYNSFKWCIDMNVDYKTIIDVIINNKQNIDSISASNEITKIIGDKIMAFCF